MEYINFESMDEFVQGHRLTFPSDSLWSRQPVFLTEGSELGDLAEYVERLTIKNQQDGGGERPFEPAAAVLFYAAIQYQATEEWIQNAIGGNQTLHSAAVYAALYGNQTDLFYPLAVSTDFRQYTHATHNEKLTLLEAYLLRAKTLQLSTVEAICQMCQGIEKEEPNTRYDDTPAHLIAARMAHNSSSELTRGLADGSQNRWREMLSIMKYLYVRGVDFTAPNSDRKVPFHYLVWPKHRFVEVFNAFAAPLLPQKSGRVVVAYKIPSQSWPYNPHQRDNDGLTIEDAFKKWNRIKFFFREAETSKFLEKMQAYQKAYDECNRYQARARPRLG